MKAGASQFLAQLLGLALALAISVAISHRLGASAQADAFLLGRRLVTGLQEVLVQVLTLVFLPMVAMQSGKAALLKMGFWVAVCGAVVAGLFALLSGPIVAVIAPELTGTTAALAARVIAILSASLPLALLGVLLGAALNLDGRFGWPALVRLAPRALVLGAFLAGLGAVQSVTWAAAGFVAGNALAVLLMLPFVRRVQRSKTSVTPHVGAAMLLVIGAQAALWLETALAARAGLGSITLLEMGQRVAALLGNTLALALVMPAFAKWTGKPETRTPQRFWQVAVVGVALLLMIQGALVLFAPRLVADVFGQGAFGAADQANLVPVIWILACAPFATLLSRLLVIWRITGQGAHLWQIGVAVSVDLAVRAVLGVWLLPLWGVQAVALGMVLGPLASALVLGFVSWRDLRVAAVPIGLFAGAGLGLCAMYLTYALGHELEWFGQSGAMPILSLMAASGASALLVLAAWVRLRGLGWVFKF